jgi:HrpA-like RNA helicase
MDSDRLASYFRTESGDTPPLLHIPGFTHPVTDLWLEDACDLLDYTPARMRKAVLAAKVRRPM